MSQFCEGSWPSDALSAWGWDEWVAGAVARAVAGVVDAAARVPVPARVVGEARGGVCTVVHAGGATGAVCASGVKVAVGDWVGLVPGGGVGGAPVVVAVAGRRSQVTRRGPSGGVQVLAANVDVVLVAAPADRVSPARVERETVLAWDAGAEPVVVVTKADAAAPWVWHDLAGRLVGVPVLVTSARTGLGAEAVREVLRPARTAVLLGPSGAGKSSLANLVLGADVAHVGAVRGADGRGRHTTTARHLVAVPGGGTLIDTPGLRALALDADADAVDAAFADVADLAGRCRFADCAHGTEPGCAVQRAVASGGLDPARLANYAKLRREVSARLARHDPVARAEQVRVVKIRTKASRAARRGRPEGGR